MLRRPGLFVYALIFVDEVVLTALPPLAPRFADELTLSTVETGVLLAVSSLATLVVAVPSGVLADRVGARILTLCGGGLLAAGSLGQGLAGDFWSLLLSRAGFGVASGVLWTAGLAWLSDSSSPGRSARALAAVIPVAGVGTMIGPVFAGQLAERVSLVTPFAAAGAAAVALTTVLGFSHVARHGEHEHQPLLATLGAARRERLIIAALAIMVLSGLSDGVIYLLAPLQLDANGLSEGSIGVVLSVGAGIITLVSANIARSGDRAAGVLVGGGGALLLGASLVPLVVSASTAAVVASVAVRAPFVALLYTISFPLGAAGAARAGLGRGAVIGLLNLGWGTATVVGPIAGGAIAETAGERAAYIALVGTCLAAAAWILLAGRARFASPADPEPARSLPANLD